MASRLPDELDVATHGGDDDHSVYFFSLDADDRLGVFLARTLFRLPYYRAEIAVGQGEKNRETYTPVPTRPRRRAADALRRDVPPLRRSLHNDL
ncbi:MAG: DUF2071 domain-containing protein [Haloquadratum sp.]